MTLNLRKTVENPKMEKKSEQKSPELIAAEQKNSFLQEQLNKLSSDQASSDLAKKADAMAKETAALESEADLRKSLGDNFSTAKAGLKDGEEISNEQMIAIMAEAVGASSDAQGKLILNKVASMMSESNTELQKTQKLLFEMAAGVSQQQARSNHADYDDYKTEIAGIMSTTRGVSPEDAYMLAKAKRSQNQPNQNQTETERPGEAPTQTNTSLRDKYVKSRQTNDGIRRSPKTIFKDAVANAIKNLPRR